MREGQNLEFAQKLRTDMTEAEKKLWAQLRARRLSGRKFKRQVPIGSFIVDFVCLEEKLIIEVDGSQHTDEIGYDENRTNFLERHGYNVVRFWNNDVMARMPIVLESILAALSRTRERE